MTPPAVKGHFSRTPRNALLCKEFSGCPEESSLRLDTMTLSFETPTCDQLVELAEELAQWQQIPWAGQLHPGDLGWHSSVGAERLAGDLRV